VQTPSIAALPVLVSRFSARGIGGFLLKTKDVSTLRTAYHVFGGITRWPFRPKASWHFIYTKIDIRMALIIDLGCLCKATVAAFGAF